VANFALKAGSADAMPRIFDHVDLRVRSLAEAGEFYRAFLPLLGFTVRIDIEGWLQFEAPGGGVTEFFGVTEDTTHRPNRSRIAFWADSRERVDALAVEIARIGAKHIEGPGFESESYYTVYFDDPSDNPLEICHRTAPFIEGLSSKDSV
jgi:catechol 2,3-dioxygenase-like lactoylglutathione lyase family enzyme